MRDERLERLSEDVRSGVPVGLREALEVIDYQEGLIAERERARAATLLGKAKIWFSSIFPKR